MTTPERRVANRRIHLVVIDRRSGDSTGKRCTGRISRRVRAERVDTRQHVTRVVGANLGILRFTAKVQRLEHAIGFSAEDDVTLGGKVASIDKTLVGQLQERTGTITGDLTGRGRTYCRSQIVGRAAGVVFSEVAILRIQTKVDEAGPTLGV